MGEGLQTEPFAVLSCHGLHNAVFSEQMDCGSLSCDWDTFLLPASGIKGRCWHVSQGCFAFLHKTCSRKCWSRLKFIVSLTQTNCSI